MGDTESDEHLRIFKCLVDTGSQVLRHAVMIKVLNNNSITFEQYLDNNKHQFYHQFEKNPKRPCCIGKSHGCSVNGFMEKIIFFKVYHKTTALDIQHCLDRFKVKAGISLDILDLSDLSFFLWNSSTLSTQERDSLMKIMSVRRSICHSSSSHIYSIDELEDFWNSLESAVLVFAEPKFYKDMVELQIKTLQSCKLKDFESEKIIQQIRFESERIHHVNQQETLKKIAGLEKLMKNETVELQNCITNNLDTTQSYINDTVKELKDGENKVCQTVVQSQTHITVKMEEEAKETRKHTDERLKALERQQEDGENKVCQTVVQSQTHITVRMEEEAKETRKHTDERFKSLERKLEAGIKTLIACIGSFGKQNINLGIKQEQLDELVETLDVQNLDFACELHQTCLTEDKEKKVIENLPPQIHIPTSMDNKVDTSEKQTLHVVAKQVNSIFLKLKATSGIFETVETFKFAMLTLVQNVHIAAGIDVEIDDTVTVDLKFESPLTKDQIAVVKQLFTNELNNANYASHLSNEYSLGDAIEEDICTELETVSQQVKVSVDAPMKRVEHVEMKNRLVQTNMTTMDIKMNLSADVPVKRIQMENKLVQTGMTLMEFKNTSSQTPPYNCRNCFEKDEIIILLDNRLCEIRRRTAKEITVFKDLMKLTSLSTSMVDDDETKEPNVIKLTGDHSSLKPGISDSEVCNLEAKAKVKSIEAQPRKVQGAGSDEPQDKSDVSNRISELRREYAGISYTKNEGQKGLAFILYSDDEGNSCYSKDPIVSHLRDFFEEMGFVVQCLGSNDYRVYGHFERELYHRNNNMFYCTFCISTIKMDYQFWYTFNRLSRSRAQDIPMVFMTQSEREPYDFDKLINEPDALLVSSFDPLRGSYRNPDLKPVENNIFDDFMKVTRSNRRADIIDILTKMNALYDCPVITVHSTLKKKFCFL